MSIGLAVNNERNHEVFNSNELPYRFTAIAEPFDVIDDGGGYRRYRKNIDGRFTDAVMVAIHIPDGIGGSYRIYTSPDGQMIQVRFSERQWNLPAPSSPPVFYLMDRVRPDTPATGFGVELKDASGGIVLNSSTPLVQVEDVVEVTTIKGPLGTLPYVSVAPSAGRLIVVENLMPRSGFGSINYNGGNAYYVAGWFLDIKDEGGYFHVRTAEWFQETGEGVEYYSYEMPLRCVLIKKPD